MLASVVLGFLFLLSFCRCCFVVFPFVIFVAIRALIIVIVIVLVLNTSMHAAAMVVAAAVAVVVATAVPSSQATKANKAKQLLRWHGRVIGSVRLLTD